MIRAGSSPVRHAEPLRFAAMERSLRAVLLGTFTLRFSTGLTGAMLAFYLAHLPEHGGPSGRRARSSASSPRPFYLAELVLSPIFGILSDRYGHHRVMLFGPIFGAIAVILTGLTAFLYSARSSCSCARRDAPPRGRLDRRERAVDPRATSRWRRPATSSSAARRRPASRARRWPASASGSSSASSCSSSSRTSDRAGGLLPQRRVLRRLVPHLLVRGQGPGRRGRGASPASTSGSTATSPSSGRRTSCCSRRPGSPSTRRIGLWFSQSIFQLAKGDPRFPDQVLMARLHAPTRSPSAAIVIAVIFGAGLLYWGNRFKTMRRTTIIRYGIVGGAVLVVRRARRQPLGDDAAGRGDRGRRSLAAGGLFVLAGATPAALGLLADISERFPTDRGAIMGLYSVFLAIGQITGSAHRRRRRRLARHRRDAHRDARPARRRARAAVAGCAAQEHDDRPVAEPGRPGRRGVGVTDGRPWVPVPLARGTPRRGRRAAPPRDARPASRSCGRAGPRSTPRSRRTPSSASSCPNSCGIGGDAFWLIWDAAGRRQVALNGSGRAPAARRRGGACARAGLDDDPAARTAVDHRARARSARGATPTRGSGGCRAATLLAPAIELARRRRSRRRPRFVDAVERTAPLVARGDRAATRRSCAVYRPHGRPWRPGERVRLPALAATLEALADDGFDAFYDGRPRRAPGARAGRGRLADHASPTCATTPRPGASRSRSTTAASGSRPTRRTAPGSSRSSCWRSSRGSSRRPRRRSGRTA